MVKIVHFWYIFCASLSRKKVFNNEPIANLLLGLSSLVQHGILELQPAGHDVQPLGGPPQPSSLLNVPPESAAAEE